MLDLERYSSMAEMDKMDRDRDNVDIERERDRADMESKRDKADKDRH